MVASTPSAAKQFVLETLISTSGLSNKAMAGLKSVKNISHKIRTEAVRFDASFRQCFFIIS